MGGRGTWSKPTETGFTSYDYHIVYKESEINFLVQHGHNDSGISAPVMSQKPNVLYVTLGKNGEPKFISKYENRKMVYQIDLNTHKGLYPHIHHCKTDGYRKEKEPLKDMQLDKEQKDLYDEVKKIFNEHAIEIKSCVRC